MSSPPSTPPGPQGSAVPVAAAERPIDPGVTIGHVHLRTADIDRVRDFYVGVLGFSVVAEARDVGGGPQPDGVAGLHHVAIRYPTRAGLADALRRLQEAGWAIRQASDHGTHEAIYISDPDGNDLELCWDRAFEAWPRDAGGHIRPVFDDLDLDDLLRAAA
jgi:catechol 2,3-dioxygenase